MLILCFSSYITEHNLFFCQRRDFIASVEWPPNSPDLNPLDFHVWGAMLHNNQEHVPQPKHKDELISVLKSIWSELPQQSIDKAILSC